MTKKVKSTLWGLLLTCLVVLLYAYAQGYDASLDWNISTRAKIVDFPAWSMKNGLIEHTIESSKFLLRETFSGSDIQRNLLKDQVLFGALWMGVCMVLAGASFLNRYVFFACLALFALLINRLTLHEVGLFGIHHRAVMGIPFLLFAIPLTYFQEYNKHVSFSLRLLSLIGASLVLLIGVKNATVFTDHLIAHSLYSCFLAALMFLFLVAEEIVFAVLYVVTSAKGGTSNHVHFTVISTVYLANLTLFYLNKTGLFSNHFFVFDPIILLAISSLITVWSYKYKREALSPYLPFDMLQLIFCGLGVIAFASLSLHQWRGNEAVLASYHYFILYFHLGFGFLFFLYIIVNFIDPIIQGFQVHRIVYKERNFPYTTARLAGLVAIAAFYFMSGQESFNLLKAGYYNYLYQKEKTAGNTLLANEYLIQATYLGYNTHYANYTLGKKEQKKGNTSQAKNYYLSASQRFPSAYALVNYGNIEAETNPNKAQAIFEEALRTKASGELTNNLALLHFDKQETDRALAYLQEYLTTEPWNQAPLLNKWHILSEVAQTDSAKIAHDYASANYGVKANILSTFSGAAPFAFSYDGLDSAKYLYRQAYLLNASHTLTHDSIAPALKRELTQSTNARTSRRLQKALALHLYNRGEVNEAFLLFDDLQAHDHQVNKGSHLAALGALSLHQGAYRQALDYFDEAVAARYEPAKMARLEALACLNRSDEISDELLQIVTQDPSLTNQGNEVLAKLPSYTPPKKHHISTDYTNLSAEQIIQDAQKNAFAEHKILAAVEELDKQKRPGSYEILVEAIEINRYSVQLLKAYINAALDWNLIEYADGAMERLRPLIPSSEFELVLSAYNVKKNKAEEIQWD